MAKASKAQEPTIEADFHEFESEDSQSESEGEVVRTEKKTKKEKKEKKGVMYIGRLPQAFQEEELRGYFSQFGEITRLRLSRNKKTGNTKHYAFIEFKHATVAEIACETMNNYLLDGHILQCEIVEKPHKNLWIGANKTFKRVPHRSIDRRVRLASKIDVEKEQKRRQKKLNLIKQKGIDYTL